MKTALTKEFARCIMINRILSQWGLISDDRNRFCHVAAPCLIPQGIDVRCNTHPQRRLLLYLIPKGIDTQSFRSSARATFPTVRRVLRVFQNEKHGGLLRFFFMFIQTPCSHTMFYLTFRCFFAIINNDKSSGYLLDRKGYFMYILRLFYMPEKTVVLPLAHSDVLQGIFYSFLSADPALAKEIHDKPPQNGKQYKFFCFSDFRGRHAVREGRLYFEPPRERS